MMARRSSSKTTNGRRKPNAKRRQLVKGLEKLENRQLLAGDVTLFADSFESGSNSNDWTGNWVEDSQNDWFRSTQRSTEGVRSADGNVYVASNEHGVVKFDGQTGTPMGVFANSKELASARGLALGPDGNPGGIHRYDGSTGEQVAYFVIDPPSFESSRNSQAIRISAPTAPLQSSDGPDSNHRDELTDLVHLLQGTVKLVSRDLSLEAGEQRTKIEWIDAALSENEDHWSESVDVESLLEFEKTLKPLI